MSVAVPARTDAAARTAWLGGRRSTGIASLAVVALVLLAVALVWFRDASDRSTVPEATGTGEATGTAEATVGPAASSSAAVPTRAPADVTWQLWNTVALPFSRSAGPARVEGQVATGFAHTPAGALVAATQASARQVAATDPGWRDVVRVMVAPGPGRDAWIAYRSRITVTGAATAGTYLQFAGFRFVSYGADDAVIQLAGRARDGGFVVTAVHLVWRAGDWRLQLGPDGGPLAARQVVPTLAGFAAWGGV